MSAPEVLARNAFCAAIEACSTARGDNYTLAGKVFQAELPPKEGPPSIIATPGWVYVTVPLYDDSELYDEDDEHGYGYFIRVKAYADETQYDETATTSAARLLNLKHDIRKAIRIACPTGKALGGLVKSCTLVGSESLAGWPVQGRRYGETHMTYRVVAVLE